MSLLQNQEERKKVIRDSFPKLFVAMDEQLLIHDYVEGKWLVDAKLQNTEPQCVAVDPFRPIRAYCGTADQGLWLTDDSGKTWRQAGNKVLGSNNITSVLISPNEQGRGFGVLYVSTEPSMVYRSEDGGETWNTSSQLLQLPSAKTWSFPPKPNTHHVRYMLADPSRTGTIYVAIEAGALIRSFDAGKTWNDGVRGGPYDTHTLTANHNAPGRLYSAAGDGYFESRDYGETWQEQDEGLEYTYLYSVAVHPSDPNTVLVSASPGPWRAYNPGNAESYIYRKTDGQRGGWELISKGLPQPSGTTVSTLTPNPDVRGEFYAANNIGVYRSQDAGRTWSKLNPSWPESYRRRHAWAIALGK
jgi:photosystem II stability/assembly factor-like uncharacterized protein